MNSLCASSVLLSSLIILSAAQGRDSYFTPPEAPFVTSPKELIEHVSLPPGRVENAQKIIDQARQQHSNSILFLEPTGTLKVSSTPLQLNSDMCLFLSSKVCVMAETNCTASSLISITNAKNVSISSGQEGTGSLDGGDHSLSGISITGGARVNLDHLLVSHCAVAGIDFKGSDAKAFDKASSVTRTVFLNNGDGLRVNQTAGFVCIDNQFKKNSGTALSITSLNSIVAGNNFSENKTALSSGSDRGIITRNRWEKNDAGLELLPLSNSNLVSENQGPADGFTISIAGSGHSFFQNHFSGTVKSDPTSKNILLLGNENLLPETKNTHIQFFNPPTFASPHSNSLVISGMGRYDLTVTGEPTMDLSTVQNMLDKARSDHMQDALVLHLRGKFVSRSPQGLQLPENACVILEGEILVDLGIPPVLHRDHSSPLTQAILMAPKGFSSFSGGKVDCAHQAFFNINASSNASSIALIEGVNMISSASDAIYIKGRHSSGPLFLYKCTISGSGERGIWPHVCTPVHSIENNCVGTAKFGIDFDAYSHDCIALFNQCSGNRVHGLFIEEGAHNNIAFGNVFSSNGVAGVHVWNEMVKANTGSNCIVANICKDNTAGISVGGRADDKTSSGNFFFNNICTGNKASIRISNHATNNFFSQCVVDKNNISIFKNSATYFFNVTSPGNRSFDGN